MITAGIRYRCHSSEGRMVGEGEPPGPAPTWGGLSEAGDGGSAALCFMQHTHRDHVAPALVSTSL